MNPLIAMTTLLLNPHIYKDMILDIDYQLSERQKKAGHIWDSELLKEAKQVLNKVNLSRPPNKQAKLLLLGWWSDSKNVSSGGNNQIKFIDMFSMLIHSCSFIMRVCPPIIPVVLQQ